MIVKLLNKHHLEFLSLKEAAQACLRDATLLEITRRGSFVFIVLFTCYHCFLKQRTVTPNRLMLYLFLTPLAVKEGPTFRNNWIS